MESAIDVVRKLIQFFATAQLLDSDDACELAIFKGIALIEADRSAVRAECADKAIAWCNNEMMDMGAFEDEIRDAIEKEVKDD